MENKIKIVLKNLQKNDFEVFFVEGKKEALEKSKEILPKKATIGLGGSVTVQEIGLLDWVLSQKGLKVHNQYETGISREENSQMRRAGLLTDYYLTGTNAVTESGFIVNVDGSGNRVAAITYGPKHVLIIIGINKIVNDIGDGFKRVLTIAGPKNVERLSKKNPSKKYTVDSISNQFSFIRRSDPKGRIKIILVNEPLGF